MSGDCEPVIIGGVRIPCDRRDKTPSRFHQHTYCHAWLEAEEAEVKWVRRGLPTPEGAYRGKGVSR